VSQYLIVIEQEGDAWGAFCPDLPGVGVAADSRAEAERLIGEAIELHVAGLRADGEPVPLPRCTAGYAIVDAA
jgi:predicted RNase H-like HicB family nuclease